MVLSVKLQFRKPSSSEAVFPSKDLKVIYHLRSSSIKGHLPSNVVFHQESSSIKGSLPSKVVFHLRLSWWSSSIIGYLPPKVVLHLRSSPTKGCLQPKSVFHQRLSSTKGHLPLKVVFQCIMHDTLMDM